MQTSAVSGTTQGPVAAAVPEPASLVLLGTALLGLVGLAQPEVRGEDIKHRFARLRAVR